MELPDFVLLLSRLERFSYGVTLDAVSYFYQFPFENGEYFALAQNNARGAPSVFTPLVPPMGWKFMPNIGQRTSMAVSKETRSRLIATGIGADDFLLEVWIDNFIGAATSLATLLQLQTMLQTVCAEANIVLHEPEVSDHYRQMHILGIVYNFHSRTFVQDDKWKRSTEDLLDHMRFRPLCYREMASVTGKLLWAAFLRHIPLASCNSLIHVCRLTAANIRDGAKWEDPFPCNRAPLRAQFIRLYASYCLPFAHKPLAPLPTVLSYSDGFTDTKRSTWAFSSGDIVRSGSFAAPINIYFAELLAASYALIEMARFAKRAVLCIDNSAVLYALHNGHSSNVAADTIIHSLLKALPSDFAFRVVHVHSAFNEADMYTREKLGQNSEGLPLFMSMG